MKSSAWRTAARSDALVVVVIGADSDGRTITGWLSALARTIVPDCGPADASGRGRGIGSRPLLAIDADKLCGGSPRLPVAFLPWEAEAVAFLAGLMAAVLIGCLDGDAFLA